MQEVTYYQVKNGKEIAKFKKTVDHSKPKIWVEGNFYKFNSHIERIYD